MAKTIKCPGCGSSLDVPSGAGEQVIRCACGKQLKIRRKERSSEGSSGSHAAMDSSSGSTVHAEVGTRCASCGAMFPADELIEEKGRMLCLGCVERKQVAATKSGKAPVGGPTRGSFIQFNGKFWLGVAAFIVAVACQIYLQITPKPEGRVIATAVPDYLRPGNSWAEQNRRAIYELLAEGDLERMAGNRGRALEKYQQIVELAANQEIADEHLRASVESARNRVIELSPPAPVAPTRTDPFATDDPPLTEPSSANVRGSARTVSVTPETESRAPDLSTPEGLLEAGSDALAREQWDVAKKHFVRLSELRPSLRDPYYSRGLIGQAAASIGQGRYLEGLSPIARANTNAPKRTPSLIVNRAIINAMTERYADLAEKDLPALQPLLVRDDGSVDQQMLDVYGTMIALVERQWPKADRQSLAKHWEAYEQAETQLERQRPGERRWGVEWLSAGVVQGYEAEAERIERERIEPLRIQMIQMERSVAMAQMSRSQPGSSNTPSPGNVEKQRADMLKQIDAFRQQVTPRTWLTRIAPAAPEPVGADEVTE